MRFSGLFPVHFFWRLRFALLLAGSALVCAGAWSQTVLESIGLLGMRREQLEPALPGARPVRSPRRLSSGALGSLRVPDVLLEGSHFEQTFYFAHQRLEQMDLVLLSPGAGPGAEGAVTQTQVALLQSLRARLGPELASFAFVPEALPDSASWVSAGADVMLFRSGSANHPGVRMVIRQRHLLDASEL